jgi:hypothetical protein
MSRSEPKQRGIPSPAPAQPRGRSLTWRREQLVAAGYDELSAQRLATDATVDVHAMIVMREQHLPAPSVPVRRDRSKRE